MFFTRKFQLNLEVLVKYKFKKKRRSGFCKTIGALESCCVTAVHHRVAMTTAKHAQKLEHQVTRRLWLSCACIANWLRLQIPVYNTSKRSQFSIALTMSDGSFVSNCIRLKLAMTETSIPGGTKTILVIILSWTVLNQASFWHTAIKSLDTDKIVVRCYIPHFCSFLNHHPIGACIVGFKSTSRVSHYWRKSMKLGNKLKGMLKWCHFYRLATPGVIDSKELLITVSKALAHLVELLMAPLLTSVSSLSRQWWDRC